MNDEELFRMTMGKLADIGKNVEKLVQKARGTVDIQRFEDIPSVFDFVTCPTCGSAREDAALATHTTIAQCDICRSAASSLPNWTDGTHPVEIIYALALADAERKLPPEATRALLLLQCLYADVCILKRDLYPIDFESTCRLRQRYEGLMRNAHAIEADTRRLEAKVGLQQAPTKGIQ